MSRIHALCGVSAIAILLAPIVPAPIAHAQSGQVAAVRSDQKELPAVTVEAPRPAVKRAAKKPAQHTAAVPRPAPKPAEPPPQPAPAVSAAVDGGGVNASYGTPPLKQRYQLPQESFTITSKQIDETINLKDPEDAVKYFPSLFVRKRNDGDNQAVLATRSWGLNSSARTLIYYDDLLISALIGNNNSGASPKWNLVSPEAIARIDFLNGPFSAAYPGNSIGGVLLITSKMPDKPFAVVKETVSVMPWSQYGTSNTYVTSQTTATAGSREGKLSWLISANYLDSWQQPLTYTTFGTAFGVGPAGTTGAFGAWNRTGGIANVLGTGALAHSQQTSENFRFAYDISPLVQATYSLGIWHNHQTSNPQTYLTSTLNGQPTFGGQGAFATNRYIWDQTNLSNAVSIKSNTKSVFDFDLVTSSYNYLQDAMLNPFTVAPTGTGYSLNGKVTRNDGTNWQNADAKGIWRPFGFDGSQEISFGAHGDRYRLENPVYLSSVWYATSSTGTGQIFSEGIGETRTGALWVQDAWKIVPNLKLTLGGRLETWRALDGFNINSNPTSTSGIPTAPIPVFTPVAINQPGLSSTNFSPKASLSYDLNKEWNVTANFGESYRYPTVTELYQNIVVAGVATFANPNLTPEQDFTGELNVERKWNDGRVRLTLFKERTNNAIISQTTNVTNSTGGQTPTTTIGNVDAIRMQGVELSADKNNVVRGVQVFGSVTYVDSRILSDPTFVSTIGGTTAVGKRVPNVPEWRAKAGVTYRPSDSWAYTVAARYTGKQYATLDNTDTFQHVYQAFDPFLVVDMKVHYVATKNFSFDFGIDNVFNAQYFLFHPFPGRTFVVAGKYTF
jgi:iron complex outermembrane receptor protein